ncbi:MAG: hypothetical protein HRU34_23675 [Richelia sp.]|nr:hypothetical protein [Richelia sp.]
MATAKAIPRVDRHAWNGNRYKFRRIILPMGESKFCKPILSIIVEVNLTGGSGRIASAGGRETALGTAGNAPIMQVLH